MEKIIIDGEVLFCPMERKISSLKSDAEATLYSASARCLLLLVNRKGEVVTQNELIEEGWGKEEAKSVAIATYYQCFVDLRKKMKEICYSRNLITTVRQKGMTLNSMVDVVIQVDDAESSGEKEEDLKSRDSGSTVIYALNGREFKKTHLNWLFLGLSIAFILAITLIFSTVYSRDPPPGFARIKGYPECYYFNVGNVDNDLVNKFMITNNYKCDKEYVYYVSYFSITPRISVFICPKKANALCESITWVESLK